MYAVCARTDAAYVPQAAFGLSRLRGARNDLDGVQQALTLVPPGSSAYPLARQHWAEALVAQPRGLGDLSASLDTVGTAGFSPRRRAEITVDAYRAALARVTKKAGAPGEKVGAYPATPDGMKAGLESALRQLAAATDNPLERAFVWSTRRTASVPGACFWYEPPPTVRPHPGGFAMSDLLPRLRRGQSRWLRVL